MKRLIFKKGLLGLFLGLSLLFFFSCAPQEKPISLGPHASERLKTIVVLPFDYYCPTEAPLPFYCPVQGVIPGEIEPNAREMMNELLQKELKDLVSKYQFYFLTQNEFETLLEEVLKHSKSPREAVSYLASRTGAQGVLYGKLFRFKERKGSGWSVNEPASVAFALVLYDGETGNILWQRTFDETQKPLSENILNLQLYGKLKWLTAKELAERGLQKLLKTFP